MLRLLPGSETNKRGLMMSILRVCAANKAAARKLPGFWSKWCESKESAAAQVSQGGLLGRITGLLADGFDATKFNVSFIQSVCASLHKEKSKLVWPPLVSAFRFASTLEFTAPQHNVRLHHGLWSLSLPDDMVPCRTYQGDPALLSLALPPPIASMMDFADREGIEGVGEFARRFPVARHPAAQTRNARSIIQRLEGDEALYTRAVRERKGRGAPALVGFDSAGIRAAVRDKAASALQGLAARVRHLHSLVSKLQQVTRSWSFLCNSMMSHGRPLRPFLPVISLASRSVLCRRTWSAGRKASTQPLLLRTIPCWAACQSSRLRGSLYDMPWRRREAPRRRPPCRIWWRCS